MWRRLDRAVWVVLLVGTAAALVVDGAWMMVR
jgi:hypothetical protein